jgi:hypothetical protein
MKKIPKDQVAPVGVVVLVMMMINKQSGLFSFHLFENYDCSFIIILQKECVCLLLILPMSSSSPSNDKVTTRFQKKFVFYIILHTHIYI